MRLRALLLCCALGCGHKATEADCQLIVDRMVEVQLDKQGITDAEDRQRQKDILLSRTTGVDNKDCLGRRITEGMLSCVRKAKSQDEITSCLR
jgi:hypothetical protein